MAMPSQWEPIQLGLGLVQSVLSRLPFRYNATSGTRRRIMRIAALSLVAALLAAGIARGQQQVPGGLPATTVQLPSFSIFSVNTTVSVPDRGGMYLGGVNRARDGSRTRGLGNRAIGSDRAANGVQVLATIHDMDELDRAVLAKAAAKRGALDPAVAQARTAAARRASRRRGR